jgi:hypothetical protein
MTLYTVALLLNVLCVVPCGHFAERKGRSRQAWSLAGAFLGPLPLMVLASLRLRDAEKAT